MARDSSRTRLAYVHGGFYLVTGIWPLLSMRTFEAITGPKVDRWLVKTAGILITAVGLGLTLAARRDRVTPEIAVTGVGAAVGLTAVDVIYVSRGRISPVYLLDAAAELGLIVLWGLEWRRSR